MRHGPDLEFRLRVFNIMIEECCSGNDSVVGIRLGNNNVHDVLVNYNNASSADDVPVLPTKQLKAVLTRLRSLRQDLIRRHEHSHPDTYDPLSLFKNKSIARSFWYEVHPPTLLRVHTPCHTPQRLLTPCP